MLYQISRLSLNQSFLESGQQSLQNSAILRCHAICDSSVDVIISIIRRFKSQHNLRTAPLIFVHGCIRAVDTVLALAHLQERDKEAHSDTRLQFLDRTLEELSSAWELATQAREGLKIAISKLCVPHGYLQPVLQLVAVTSPDIIAAPGSWPEETTSNNDEKADDYETAGFTDTDFWDLCGINNYHWNSVTVLDEEDIDWLHFGEVIE